MNLSFLGLMYKANKLTLGRDNVKMALDKGRLALIITAKDLSPRYKGDLESKAIERNIRIVNISTKKELGQIFGRTDVGIIGITDRKIADKVIEGVL